MLNSMTAYAHGEASGEALVASWEIRSVNHRYLDLSLKLGDLGRPYEAKIREAIAAKLARGRIDATLSLVRHGGVDTTLLDQSLIENLQNWQQQVATVIPAAQPLSVGEVLAWPGVMGAAAVDEKAVEVAVFKALDSALKRLIDARHSEGSRLEKMIVVRLNEMRDIVSALKGELPRLEQLKIQRWQSRLNELTSEDLDPVRLNQEIALMVSKGDVAEELDRLESHFKEMDLIIVSNKPCGKRLDFMTQELNREANTLGSKAFDERMTQASVSLKVLIDQVREQVQNVE